MEPNYLTAIEAAEAIREGTLSSEELVHACLTRIDELEHRVSAWAHLDADYALEQARQADKINSRGQTIGPLHGLPVGIKDIIDTADLPTENGCLADEGRSPGHNATVVDLLRQSGAVILGKTVTAELATHSPGKTTNPHDPARTPGGSSSGSAAAVAACMTPLALGTQTNGSVIRPAAYCGVYGFKPTFGRISRCRISTVSRFLDSVGVFGRTLIDVALLADALMHYDSRDPDMQPRARPQLVASMIEAPLVAPRIAFVRTPLWEQVESSSKAIFEALIESINQQHPGRIKIIDLHPAFELAHEAHSRIMYAELANNFEHYYRESKSQLTAQLVESIEFGQKILAMDYIRARGQAFEFNGFLDGLFTEYDAILTPSAFGEAPADLSITGDPAMCTIWSLCGVPAVTLPIFKGPANLPIGAQLVAARGDDARLLRAARWLLSNCEA